MAAPIGHKSFYSRPTNSSNLERGFHSNSFLSLNNRNFSSEISSTSYLSLKHVTAPSVRSGSYASLNHCEIANSLSSQSYASVKNCFIKGSIQSNSYVSVSDSSSVNNINSTSYVAVKSSEIGQINSGSYVSISQGSNVNSIASKSYVDIKDKSEFGHIQANSYVVVNNSNGKKLKSDSYVNANFSSISEIIATDFAGKQSKHDLLDIEDGIALEESNVFQKATANSIRATNCLMLGVLVGNEDVTTENCPLIESIKTNNLILKKSNVKGNIVTTHAKIIGSTIEGELTTADQELKITESYVNKLVLKKSSGTISHLQIDGVNVPSSISTIVQAIRDKKISVENRFGNYSVKLLDSSSGSLNQLGSNYYSGRGINIQGGSINLGGISLGGSYSSVRIGNIVSTGSISIGGNGTISIGGASNGSMNVNGINVSGSGFSIKNGQLIKGSLKIPFNKEKFQEALDFLENWEMHVNESALASQNENKTQRVVISGGHVEEIIFEEPGGQVVMVNGGTVGKINNGRLEDLTIKENTSQEEEDTREEKELPRDFECPISLDLMENPWQTPGGHTFDYENLLRLTDQVSGTFKCPLTRKLYNLSDCSKNNKLYNEIITWLKSYKPKI